MSSLITTPHLPHNRQHHNLKKRPRVETAVHGGEPISEERRKKRKMKRKRGNGGESINSVSAASTVGTVANEKEKEKEWSRKQKHSDVSSGGPYTADHGLDPASLMNVSTAVDSFASDLHMEPSDNDSLQQFNNDDILRAFQSLDFSRLAGVLRSLEIPSAGVDLGTGDNPFTAHLDANGLIGDQITFTDTGNPIGTADLSVSAPPDTTHISRGAVAPSSAAQRPPKVCKSIPKLNPNLPAIGPSIANPEHTELLATKWLSAAKLKELVQSEGLVYKKGKFSSIEQHSLNTAMEHYRVNHGLSQEEMIEVIFSKSKEEHGSFWSEITASVPARPIIAVYHYVHRAYNPLGFQGRWTKEEDAALISAVGDLGQAWQTVKERVGRSANDCRDRWRNHLANRSERQRGTWSKAEEEELTRIVQELTTDQGKNSDNDIFWGIVSQRMGNKRSRQQCRIKWTDSLNKTVKNGGEKPRWNKQDSFILVLKVASLGVRDDSEIHWQSLNNEDWNLWSAHILQRQWRRLKHAIKGHEEMAHQEIIEVLKQKNALPQTPKNPKTPKSPRKTPKSAVVIEDEQWESEEEVDLGG